MWKTINYKGEQVWYSEEDIKPFLDPYFKGLDFKTIAELAKKSIGITTYNSELEHKIEDAVEACNGLKYENEELKDENHYLREGLERQVCFTTNAEVYAEKCHETLEEIKAMTNIDCKECVQIIDKINLFINENG